MESNYDKIFEKTYEEVYEINLKLTKQDFDVLVKSIDFYNYACSIIAFGNQVEICQGLREKIVFDIQQIEK